MRCGWQARVSTRSSSYSSGETPYFPKVSTPISATAAATSSWVESGLQPVRYTSAPPLARTRPKLAVFASRWTETAIRMPLKGCSFSNLFSISVRAGMKDLTHSIFFLPDGAREASLILLILSSFLHILSYRYLSTIFCTSKRTRSLSIVRSSCFRMTNFPSIMTDSTSDPFAE